MMAKRTKERIDTVNHLEFSERDKALGGARLQEDPEGLIPVYDIMGRKRWRRKGRLAGGVRDRILMAQMKAGMAALWADGHSFKEIAERVSDFYELEGDHRMTDKSIQYHLRNMLLYWQQKGLALIDERQAAVLARFEQIESLAVEAYFASMEDESTTHISSQIEKGLSYNGQRETVKGNRGRSEKNKTRQGKAYRDPKLFIDGTTDAEDNPLDISSWGDDLVVVSHKTNESTKIKQNNAGDPKFLNIMVNINAQRARILGLFNRTDRGGDATSEAAKLSDEQRQARIATILSAARERRNKSANMLADAAPLGGHADGEEMPDGQVVIEKEVDPIDDDGAPVETVEVEEWD